MKKPPKRVGKLRPVKFIGKMEGQEFWQLLCDCGQSVVGPINAVTSCGKCPSQNKSETPRCPKLIFVFKEYKRRAYARGLEFHLTLKDFTHLIFQDCFYCGAPPERLSAEGLKYAGIDRILSSEGYTLENTVPCCTRCNRAKGNVPQLEFLDWVKKVYNHCIIK